MDLTELQTTIESLQEFKYRTESAQKYGYHLSIESAADEWFDIHREFETLPAHLQLIVFSTVAGELRFALGHYDVHEIEEREYTFEADPGVDTLALKELGSKVVSDRIMEALYLATTMEDFCFVLHRCNGIPNPTIADVQSTIATMPMEAAAAYLEGVLYLSCDEGHWAFMYPENMKEEDQNVREWSSVEWEQLFNRLKALCDIIGRQPDERVVEHMKYMRLSTQVGEGVQRLITKRYPHPLVLRMMDVQLWELIRLLQTEGFLPLDDIGWQLVHLVTLESRHSGERRFPVPPHDLETSPPDGDPKIDWLTTPTDFAGFIRELEANGFADANNISDFVSKYMLFPRASNPYIDREKFRNIYKNFTSRSEGEKAKGRNTHRILPAIRAILGISK